MKKYYTCWKCGKRWGSGLPFLLNVYAHNPNGYECNSSWECHIRAERKKSEKNPR